MTEYFKGNADWTITTSAEQSALAEAPSGPFKIGVIREIPRNAIALYGHMVCATIYQGAVVLLVGIQSATGHREVLPVVLDKQYDDFQPPYTDFYVVLATVPEPSLSTGSPIEPGFGQGWNDPEKLIEVINGMLNTQENAQSVQMVSIGWLSGQERQDNQEIDAAGIKVLQGIIDRADIAYVLTSSSSAPLGPASSLPVAGIAWANSPPGFTPTP